VEGHLPVCRLHHSCPPSVYRYLWLCGCGEAAKKTFYRHFFSDEWTRAVMELECVAPLLSLCAGTWKAELTLGSALHDSRPLNLPSLAPTNMMPPHSTPSNIAPHSRSAPRSSSIPRSSWPPTPSHLAGPSHAPPSPHHASFKLSQVPAPTQPHVPSGAMQPPPEPQPANKGSKGKHKRDASLLPQSDSIAVEEPWHPSPRPAFFSKVPSGALEDVSFIFPPPACF
jgi:hypothetical protein